MYKFLFNFVVNSVLVFWSLLIFGFSCNVSKQANVSELQRVWMLTEFDSFAKAEMISNRASLDLTKMSNAPVYMGCNHISFAFKVYQNHKIQFNDGVSTEMACPKMNLEQKFVENLPKINSYKVEGHRLYLYGDQNLKMVFVAQDWD